MADNDKETRASGRNSEECTHNCSTCGAACASRTRESLKAEPNGLSDIKKVIAVASGKGGVGKSLVTSLLAVELSRRGRKVAVLDADVTGPSIPRIFGVKGDVTGCDDGIFPLKSKGGIEVMSVNLLLDKETTPVVWRGPVIANTVRQFWSDVVWGDIDYMFVDMPPGTGDVPLTVFQALPVDGVIIVTSPQELVGMIVAKARNMAQMMNIPVLGVVENYSWLSCPDCGKKIPVFGEFVDDEKLRESLGGLKLLARIPLDPKLAALCDRGIIESMDVDYVKPIADSLEA